jgi:hypothetical protein
MRGRCCPERDGARLAQFVVPEPPGADDDRRHPRLLRRLHVERGVPDHHAGRVLRCAELLQRHLQQVRRGLGRVGIGAGGPVVGEVPGVQQVECEVDVPLSAGAGQDEPVAPLLDRDEQVARTGQRGDLIEQRVDLLALPLARLVADPFLQLLAAERGDQLVPAHPDQPVDPPDRERLVERAQGPVPRHRVLVVGVDQGSVDVEDGDALLTHDPPMPTIGDG